MTVTLRHGYNQAIPENVSTAWGARLIAPAEFIHDRQDLTAENETAEREVIAWLNVGFLEAPGDGAISKALSNLRAGDVWPVGDDEEFTAYEDDRGRILARRSGEYVYLAGWLHPSGERAGPTVEQSRRLHVLAHRFGWPAVDHAVTAQAEELWGPYEPDEGGPPTSYMLWRIFTPEQAETPLNHLAALDASTLAS